MRYFPALPFLALFLTALDATAQPSPAPLNINLVVTTPLPLLYLEQQAVRDDLKLTLDQTKKVDALRKDWADKSREIDLERGSTVDAATLMNESRKALENTLTVAQMKRLNQIILRHREKEHGMSAVLSTVARDLKLSDSQQERFDMHRRKRAEAIFEYLTSGERANAIHRSVHEANQEFVEAVDKLLTKDQQARLKEMLGEPFAAEIRLSEPQTVAIDLDQRGSVYLEALWGRYGLEAEIIKNESVHKELKLSDDQIRKAKEFNVEWWQRYEQERKDGLSEPAAVAWLSPFVIDQIQKILNGAQQLRFHEIATQHRMAIAGNLAGYGYPTVKARLTEQRAEQLRTGVAKATGSLVQVLAEGIGAKFNGELKIKSPFKIKAPLTVIKPKPPTPAIQLLPQTQARFILDNARRYGLDQEQIARLKAIDDDYPKLRQLLHRELSQLPPSTDGGAAKAMLPEAQATERFRKAIYEQALEVLDDKQRSRWGAEIRARANFSN